MQLELFEPLSIESANELLDLLNDDRKKDLFEPVSCVEVDGMLLLCAKNKEYGMVFNVVDRNGKTPESMSANWRNFEHIKQELKLN